MFQVRKEPTVISPSKACPGAHKKLDDRLRGFRQKLQKLWAVRTKNAQLRLSGLIGGFEPLPLASCPADHGSVRDRRRAVGMERLDRFKPPPLALLAFLLGPHDRLPVRRQDEPGAGVGDLDAVAAGLVDVEEERLLDRMLVRAGLDIDPVLQEDIGGAQDLLAAVKRIGDVMEAPRRIRTIM